MILICLNISEKYYTCNFVGNVDINSNDNKIAQQLINGLVYEHIFVNVEISCWMTGHALVVNDTNLMAISS